jgi:hypothetical protein
VCERDGADAGVKERNDKSKNYIVFVLEWSDKSKN